MVLGVVIIANNSVMWMVRAGEGAYLIDEFKNKNIVAVGWVKIENLLNIKDLNEIKKLVREKYPENKPGQVIVAASQINKFRFDFEKGDYVISYVPDNRVYLVGQIISDYKYDKNLCEYHHIREVKWLGEVKRDDLSTTTKNTLGAISTIFDVGKDAQEELLKLLKGEKVSVETPEEQETELEQERSNVASRSREFIKDKISSLDWEEMQDLVAGMLRAMGYKTIVSAKGSDRGRDVQASRDGLGLEEPRIIVEVKHRSGQMGSQEIRAFIGGLRESNKGLYVSTGGFTKEAKYEAERSIISITLIDSDVLADIIVQYYDNFDPTTRALIPLTKIYWPV